MAVHFQMLVAKRTPNGSSSDPCELLRFGLDSSYGLDSSKLSDIGVGLLMARIAQEKYMSFTKVIDPIVTQRLVRAHTQNKKFRDVVLNVFSSSGTTLKEFKYTPIGMIFFNEVLVDQWKQLFYGGVLADVASITANSATFEVSKPAA